MPRRKEDNDPDYNPLNDPEDIENETEETDAGAGERVIDLSNAEQDMDEYLVEAQNPNTRRAMEHSVKQYNDVMKSLKSQTGGQQYKPLDETDIAVLPANLCRYFAVLVSKDGSVYNATSLKQFYNRLATWILKKRNVNIKQDPRFSEVLDVVKKRCGDSIKAGKRPGVNASRAVPEHLTQEAVKQGKFSRDTPRTLIRAVVYHLMTSCGTRALQVNLHYHTSYLS